MIAPWLLVVVFSLVLLAAAAGTWLLRHYALTHSVLDIPNDRSSHTSPTPRGGGVAIVLAFIAGILTFTVVGAVRSDVAIALLGAGTVVAIVGFIDDHEHIPARWRLLAHFSAAIWALVWLHGLPPMAVMGGTVISGWLGDVLAILALVWLLNLYNFMDGIDGIAGIETVTVCLAAVLVYAVSGAPTSESLLPATLGAATVGFLVWNFPPAKIFMGDAGSGFLGLMLGVMAVRSATISSDYLWSWIILLGVFIVDATFTLIRRLARRERVYEAHRSHAYQHAVVVAGSHRPVTLASAAINLCWLLPLALLAGAGHLDGAVATAIAYTPLVWLAFRFRAGAATA